MYKKIIIWIVCAFLFMPFIVKAAPASLPEEALLSTLFPAINEEIEKQYGTIKKYNCAEIISLQKKYPNTYVFTSKIRLVTYEKDYQPPFEELTFTFSNERGIWEIVSVNRKKLPNDFAFSSCKK